LTEKELESIERKKFDIERLMIVKDVFVFCCYTGLAYVDVTNLTLDNIVTGIDGKDWIKISRQKTGIPVNMPILPVAKMIMNKYLNHYRSSNLETIFLFFQIKKLIAI